MGLLNKVQSGFSWIGDVYANTAYVVKKSAGAKIYYGAGLLSKCLAIAGRAGAIVVSGKMGDAYTKISVDCWWEEDDSQPDCQVDIDVLQDESRLYTYIGAYLACIFASQFLDYVAENMIDRGAQIGMRNIHVDYIDKANSADLIEHNAGNPNLIPPSALRPMKGHTTKLTKSMFHLHTALAEVGALVWVLSTTFHKTLGVTFVYVPILPVLAVFINKEISQYAMQMEDGFDSVAGLIIEDLANIVAVKTYSGERLQKDNIQAALDRALSAQRNFLDTKLKSDFMRQFVFFGSLVLGGLLYIKGETKEERTISPNEVLSLANILILLSAPIMKTTDAVEGIAEANGPTARVLSFARSAPGPAHNFPGGDLEQGQGEVAQPGKYDKRFHKFQSLSLNQLSFEYPTPNPTIPAKRILNRVTLQVNAGNTLAIVGPSGIGKSTITKLIMGLYAPTSGNVSVSLEGVGQAVPVSIDVMKEYATIVHQNTDIFNADLYYNIEYPNLGIPFAEMEQVVEEIGLTHRRPQGENAPRQDNIIRAQTLSGGERTRVGIGRSLVRKSQLYILDEITAGLDPIVAKELILKLNEIARKNNAAALIITHNLETIKEVDEIVFLGPSPNGSEIVERGTYSALLAEEGGHLRRFLDAQKTSFKLRA